jgi:protein-tyrosine phosphatase
MKVNIYWIPIDMPGRLGIMPRPRGGDWLEDEILALKTEDVDILVSLLTAPEVEELDLTDERHYCARNGIEFLSFAVEDRSVPARVSEFSAFLREIETRWLQSKSVVIHCRMGVGRSALTAACLLVMRGLSVVHAFERIEKARGCMVPDTREQRGWVDAFARGLPEFGTAGRK